MNNLRADLNKRSSDTSQSLLALLQLSDSAIPIGGYSHSWGLESWVQNGTIDSAQSAQTAIVTVLRNSIAPQDGIACGCAHRFALAQDLSSLSLVNQYLSAGKWSKETYQASIRMGQRLIKLAADTNFVSSMNGLENWQRQPHDGTKLNDLHHSTIFGWLAACAGISETGTVSAYLHNSAVGLISACVRLIPLGHTDGQKIIVNLRPLIAGLAQNYSGRQITEISSFAPLNEAASFAHESLYSRLFQS